MVNQIDFAGGTEHAETPSVTSQGREQDFVGPASAAVSPLIGRNAELRLLEDRWEQAQEGQSQIVLVLGEAGLGKSRLVRTVAHLIRENSVSADQPQSQVVEWRCAEHFQNSELHPISDFMNRFLGFGADDSSSGRFERLAYLKCFVTNPRCGILRIVSLILPSLAQNVATSWTSS
jgi:DNA-binding NtrC family response regulator